jgi:predicted dehydrogenase
MAETTKVGIIGTGKIAPAYMKGTGKFPILEVTACADIHAVKAREFGKEFNLRAYDTVDQLLADPEIQIVINLTVPAVHAEVSLKILEAGKHVHVEKPLAVTREDGRKVVERARELGLTVTSAPDTFLGGGGQTARKLLDEGAIGQPTAAMAYLYKGGPERGHPNPWFFYKKGGGPLFDMGPYYLTALVNLLGPVKRVAAIAAAT